MSKSVSKLDRSRKSRSTAGLAFLSFIVKKHLLKVTTRLPWRDFGEIQKYAMIKYEDTILPHEIRCPNCDKLLMKINFGDIFEVNQERPPVIEIKCGRNNCKAISRHVVYNKEIHGGKRKKIR